ncbi:MAG: PaaI family thioesterase [Anaerolineae bacterium]|nr:PaaI family thioesterase [Anaerolineae bacterium]
MIDLQPTSKHCFVCGIENPVGLKLRFVNNPDGTMQTILNAPEHFQGYPGIVHGGIVATALDETMGRAAMNADGDRFLMTAKMEIRYRHPVPTGQPVKIVTRIEKDRGRLVTVSGKVYLPDGALAVEATGLMAEMPEAMRAGMDPEAQGWKVYPLGVYPGDDALQE